MTENEARFIETHFPSHPSLEGKKLSRDKSVQPMSNGDVLNEIEEEEEEEEEEIGLD